MEDFNIALLEATVGHQKTGSVVMIGRCQPPTEGHYKVIDAMKAFIRKNKNLNLSSLPIVMIVTGENTSKDVAKNPLSAEDRIKFMRASGRANGVTFGVVDNAFNGFEAVRKLGYEPIAIAAGSDRAEKYIEMLNKYFTNDGEPITHYIVPGLERQNPDDGGDKSVKSTIEDIKDGGVLNDAEISGSMARTAIEMGFEDVFAKIVGLTKKPKLAKLMFDKIKSTMESK